MMTKKKTIPLARKAVEVTAITPAEGARAMALTVASPEFSSVRVIHAVESPDIKAQLDLPALINVLNKQGDTVNKGDMALSEAMLINQAVALQSLFARLVERGMGAELMSHYEAHLRFALRAQAQCTRTLEVLAAIKSPPVVFAQQANIAQQQQVNNGVVSNEATRARATEISQNKLLEERPDERLDTRTQSATRSGYSSVEAVGAVYRPEVARG